MDVMTSLALASKNDAFSEVTTRNSQTEAGALGYNADPEFRLRGGYSNPMVDAAMPLFGLVIRLRTLDQLPNIEEVYTQVRNQVSTILEELRQHTYEPAHLLAYSYALCLHVDEAVMSRPWGKSSRWSQEPLLSVFHHETWGGEKFFTVLSRMLQEPQRYKDVLEFMYLCLCLGLKGKYGVAPRGDEALQSLIDKLYRVIRELRGPIPERACEPLTHVAPSNYRMNRQWPWWSPLAICTALMAVTYAVYSHRLHLITSEVLRSLNGVLLQ
ncbi:type IVB secretion system protein IcmH/DotU [Pseudomonas entomophila]|nr:type IVB secretion system protein IcmH/DotU [Pseudomonas entomophila]MDF0729251.1 type IVB secretion system protein IcmH/DotU [Pseudomonas entomophila]